MSKSASSERSVATEHGRRRGRVLTERDLAIGEWIERVGGATIGDVQMRFGLRRTVAFRRIAALADFGVIHRHRMIIGMPALLSCRASMPRLDGYRHTVALAGLVATRELAGGEILTEAEVLRLRSSSDDLFEQLDDPALEVIRNCDRVPDAIERTGVGGLIAWEVELTSKGKSRRERILGRYAASRYEEIRWLVPDPKLAALIAAEIERMGLGEFMRVGADAGSLA